LGIEKRIKCLNVKLGQKCSRFEGVDPELVHVLHRHVELHFNSTC
jgi:hypothetical protein